MDINMIGLAVGKVEAERRGVQEPDSTRIGVVSALTGSPLMSFVISRAMADRQLADAQPAVTDSTDSTDSTDIGGSPAPGLSRAEVQEVVDVALEPLSKALEDVKANLEEVRIQITNLPKEE